MGYNGYLSVGQKVRLFYNDGMRTYGSGIVTSATHTRAVVDFLEGENGAYRGWQISRKSDGFWGGDGSSGHITLLGRDYTEEIKKTVDRKHGRAKRITVSDITLTRVDGVQVLNIKVDNKIEEFFKKSGAAISEAYKDIDGNRLSYYPLDERTITMYRKFRETNRTITIEKYGYKLFSSGYPNLSVLRTVGISKGIRMSVEDLIMEDEFDTWGNAMSEFLKFLYQKYISPKEYKAKIILEQ